MKPTAMLFRNLMSMDVEECIRAYPLDAVVLIGGCDKTVPAQLMGAASADVPAIMLTGGPLEPACFRGRELGAGTDLWHYADELRAGRMSEAGVRRARGGGDADAGHCNEMGTASTMAALVEALGMSLPGTAAIPAVDGGRGCGAAEATGARAVELAREELRPAAILTAAAFDNAITLLMALGGGDERRRPPARARRARGRAAHARALRRARAPHAGPRRTCGLRASTCSRTCTAPAASPPCCTSSRRCCTRTR